MEAEEKEDSDGILMFLGIIFLTCLSLLISHLMGGLWGSLTDYQVYRLDLSRTYNAQEISSINKMAGVNPDYIKIIEGQGIILSQVEFHEKPDKIGLYPIEDYWVRYEVGRHFQSNIAVIISTLVFGFLSGTGILAILESWED